MEEAIDRIAEKTYFEEEALSIISNSETDRVDNIPFMLKTKRDWELMPQERKVVYYKKAELWV